ncbi:hypothetical protein HQ531_05420 [bacterium]|nr:hypothetical protein [bacterium]
MERKITIAIVCVVLFALILIPIPSQITLPGRVIPMREWVFVASGNGSHESLGIDNRTNQKQDQKYFIPQRGELFSFIQAAQGLREGSVEKGDTLGIMHSSAYEERLLSLTGSLQELNASLEFLRSGSRETVIAAARSRVDYARARHAEQVKETNRAQGLLNSAIISQQEYDQEARQERLDAIKVSIAESDLGSALSGAQSSELKVIQARINEKEAQIGLTQELMNQMVLTAPFQGHLSFPYNRDTLMTVSDMDSMVIYVPVNSSLSESMDLIKQVTAESATQSLDIELDQVTRLDQLVEGGGAEFNLYRIVFENQTPGFPSGKMINVKFGIKARTGLSMIQSLLGI